MQFEFGGKAYILGVAVAASALLDVRALSCMSEGFIMSGWC